MTILIPSRDRGTYTAGTANATPVFELWRQLSYFAAPFLWPNALPPFSKYITV